MSLNGEVQMTIEPSEYINTSNPHNGKKITEVAVSPNGTFVVTYSEYDDTIVGWNVDQLEPEVLNFLSLEPAEGDVKSYVYEIKVSDSKLVIITYWGTTKPDIFQLGIKDPIKCNIKKDSTFDFTQNDKLIVCSKRRKSNQILVHSLPPKNNKLNLESVYKVYCDDELSKLGKTNDKTDQMWATSNRYLYLWDLNDTSKFKFEYCYSHKLLYPQYAEVSVSVNGDKISVCDTEKIFILKNNHSTPIRYIKSDLREPKAKLISNKLLLVFEDEMLESDEENKENKGNDRLLLYDISDHKQAEFESLENDFIIYDYNSQTNKAYGINNEGNKILTIEFKNDQSWETHFTQSKKDEVDEVDAIIGWNIYLDDVYESHYEVNESDAKIHDLIKKQYYKKENFPDHGCEWNINPEKQVVKVKPGDTAGKWSCKRVIHDNPVNWILLKKNVLALLFDDSRKQNITRKQIRQQTKWPTIIRTFSLHFETGIRKQTRSLAIFRFDSDRKDLQLQYYGYLELQDIPTFQFFENDDLPHFGYLKDISKYNNSIDKLVKVSFNHDYRLEREWLDVVATDDFILLNYGMEYFKVFIDNGASEYIAKTYDACIKNIKNDTKSDIQKVLKFLNIITTSIAELVEKYPDYLKRFNSDMFILLDPSKKRRVKSYNQHLYSYDKKLECVRISLLYYKFKDFLKLLTYFLKSPIMTYYYLRPPIDDYSEYAILISSYNNFSRYPEDYSWWKELLRPKSSTFVKTCDREFYDNWNGEAIVNFKWRIFGRYYYSLIWLKFMAFFSFFVIGSLPYTTFNTNNESRAQFYYVSIVLGLVHLLFEIRQLIWDPRKYITSIWNYFDLGACLFPILTSYYWLIHNYVPNWAISATCLFLCMKFLLFFRAFESFGVYYAITFGVARRVFSFLVILVIIIASFALSFHLLLYPVNFHDSLSTPNFNDPNNPWTLSPTYNRKFKNGSIDSSSTLIQTPDESTNMFASYHAALLAMYLFLSGDTESLSPWPTTAENAPMIILLVLFSFLIVVYLMNLFIGLLNMEIEQYSHKASYLVQKAEILIEIELFYLLPFQRRWDDWFPETIRYYARIDEGSNYIGEAIKDGKWNSDDKVLKVFGMKSVDPFNNIMM